MEKTLDLLITIDTRQVKNEWRNRLFSLCGHALMLCLAALPAFSVKEEKPQEQKEVVLTEMVDIAPYKAKLPPLARKRSGGGGGGGERNPLPASKGRLPKFSLNAQLTPPAAVIRNQNPRLAAEPTVVVPPNIEIPSPNTTALGDPLSGAIIPSGGPGFGGGIGTGSGGGVGSGTGPGVGPGHGGGFGGGAFRVGGSVSAPVCVYCPQPEYPEEARKARYQGTVVLWARIDEKGKVVKVVVQKSLGLGCDEEAIRAVMQWRFTPADRFGKPVPVDMSIEVDFRLY